MIILAELFLDVIFIRSCMKNRDCIAEKAWHRHIVVNWVITIDVTADAWFLICGIERTSGGIPNS